MWGAAETLVGVPRGFIHILCIITHATMWTDSHEGRPQGSQPLILVHPRPYSTGAFRATDFSCLYMLSLSIFYNTTSDLCCLFFLLNHHGLLYIFMRSFAQADAPPEGLERRGCPPVPLAEQAHGGGDKQHAYQGGVDNNGDGEADADFLD